MDFKDHMSDEKLPKTPIPSKWRSRKQGTRYLLDESKGGHYVYYIQGRLPVEIHEYDQKCIPIAEWRKYQKTARLLDDYKE